MFICIAYKVEPEDSEHDYIGEFEMLLLSRHSFSCHSMSAVGFDPKPVPGMHDYHMAAFLCDEPGYRGPGGELVAWACKSPNDPGSVPPFICMSDGPRDDPNIPAHQPLQFQYQNGPPELGALKLPEGFGIPVGGEDDYKYVVVAFHYPLISRAIGGMTGVSEVDLILKNLPGKTKPVYPVNFKAYGDVDPHSKEVVSASWTPDLDGDIRLLTVYVHWHDQLYRAVLTVVHPDGSTDKILDKDTKVWEGQENLPDIPSVHMHPGDKLILDCYVDNQKDITIHIGYVVCLLIFII